MQKNSKKNFRFLEMFSQIYFLSNSFMGTLGGLIKRDKEATKVPSWAMIAQKIICNKSWAIHLRTIARPAIHLQTVKKSKWAPPATIMPHPNILVFLTSATETFYGGTQMYKACTTGSPQPCTTSQPVQMMLCRQSHIVTKSSMISRSLYNCICHKLDQKCFLRKLRIHPLYLTSLV